MAKNSLTDTECMSFFYDEVAVLKAAVQSDTLKLCLYILQLCPSSNVKYYFHGLFGLVCSLIHMATALQTGVLINVELISRHKSSRSTKRGSFDENRRMSENDLVIPLTRASVAGLRHRNLKVREFF